jgi:hypothetical protein
MHHHAAPNKIIDQRFGQGRHPALQPGEYWTILPSSGDLLGVPQQ